MGHAYSRINDHENAVLCFTQALELIHTFETDPDYFDSDWSEEKARYLYSRGLSYLSMGNHLLEAIDDAAAAIALEPENVDNYNLRGVSYLLMGEAEKRFAKDLQGGILGRKLTLAYLEDRIATRGRPELAKQMAQFRRLYDMNRDRSFAFLLDILGEMINDDCDNAIADFNKCIELVPDAAPYWCSRGRAWLQKNELKPAFDDLQQALALDPEHPLALQYMKEVQAE
jgi:tetratricopeptide (TPR) repeat protein